MAAPRVVVDCRAPFVPRDPDRQETLTELVGAVGRAMLAGDFETAEEKFDALVEAETLPTVSEALDGLRSGPASGPARA